MKQTENHLSAYGWIRYSRKFDISEYKNRLTGAGENLEPARIVTRYNRTYLAAAECGTVTADYIEGTGAASSGAAFPGGRNTSNNGPCSGDWVLITPSEKAGESRLIKHILPRYGALSRSAAGRETREQALAANIDVAFIVTSLDDDFSAARIERFLTIAREADTDACILLNKADAAKPEALARALAEAEEAAAGSPVYLASARTGMGMEEASCLVKGGKTAVLLGSSGVGKSTIINYLLGEAVQDTGSMREWDSKGRHTTVRRELFPLPSGGVIIDSPGIRGLKLWASESSLDAVFTDIEEMGRQCRFSDCSHNGEPDCAVAAALKAGDLSAARFNNYIKLKKELRFLENRKNDLAARLEKAKWKTIHRQIKEYYKFKRGG